MAKLPADLPENWTQGEIISPNGTEVGLTEQHGYNYLMKQVNATQNEVNNVGTTLNGVAKEASVQQIDAALGKTADVGGTQSTGTAMAKLNKILEKCGIGETGKTILQILEELLQQPKVIKHIQRGLINYTSTSDDTSNAAESVTLAGFTNIEKMIVILDGSVGRTKNGATTTYTPYVSELTVNTLTTTVSIVNNTYTIGYQVIEFC